MFLTSNRRPEIFECRTVPILQRGNADVSDGADVSKISPHSSLAPCEGESRFRPGHLKRSEALEFRLKGCLDFPPDFLLRLTFYLLDY